MSDFYINRRRDRVTIVPLTSQGRSWMRRNISADNLLTDNIINIDIEHLEDYIKMFEEEELTYEER